MAKTILGIDIGHDTLKLALVNGSQIKQTVSIPMSNSVVRDGVITAPEMFGDLLRTILKDNGIKCDGASFALSDSSVFTRNVTSPKMSEKQLLVNIPYEFKDYITSDLKDYVFDYAMITQPQNNDNAKEKNQGKEKKQKKEKAKKGENAQVAENPQEAEQTSETENNQVLDNTTSYDLTDTMQYLAVAAPVSLLDNLRVVCKKAGIRFLGAAPDICCYISLIRNMKDQNRPASGEYCILDLGYKEVRMHMFKNDVNIATRVLDFGMAVIDDVISGLYEIDNKTAHTYLLTNRDSWTAVSKTINVSVSTITWRLSS